MSTPNTGDFVRSGASEAGIIQAQVHQLNPEKVQQDFSEEGQVNLTVNAVSDKVKAGVAEAIGSFQKHLDSIISKRKS